MFKVVLSAPIVSLRFPHGPNENPNERCMCSSVRWVLQHNAKSMRVIHIQIHSYLVLLNVLRTFNTFLDSM